MATDQSAALVRGCIEERTLPLHIGYKRAGRRMGGPGLEGCLGLEMNVCDLETKSGTQGDVSVCLHQID